MSLQEQMKATLEQTGIPAKEIKCYGSQIMIICMGRDTARKWDTLLRHFCRTVRSGPTVQYNKQNRNTVLRPTRHKAWSVWGTV